MGLFQIIELTKSKNNHFLSVSYSEWKKFGLLIRLLIWFNPNYKFCKIYRKKYKQLENFVVFGLKWSGKNVKRRTTGFAKEFLKRNRNTSCIYCEKKLTEENATTDHIIPISDGGNNSQVNLLVCCFDCNNERGNLSFFEYLKQKNPKFRKSKSPFI
jgi:CRISPR/Cas system Type II protein with McrA/HNH and RuvC-like nuclease domain